MKRYFEKKDDVKDFLSRFLIFLSIYIKYPECLNVRKCPNTSD